MKFFRAKPTTVIDSDRFLRVDHLSKDLKGRTVRGGAVTIVTQALKFVIRTGSTIFLARLLSPEDYGLFGMVTVVVGFVELFKDMGLSAATVQKEQINHQQVSTLFWINVAVSLAIACLVAALAPAVAWFYSEPRLIAITVVLASTFLISGLTVQHQALLRRQMRFTSIASIEVISMMAGIVTALISAAYGTGYWSLVHMQLSTSVVNLIGAWVMCGWRPGLPSKQSGIQSMLRFGGNLTGFRCVNYFSRNLDNVLIGRVWGAQQLGLYAKAYQLLLLPITQINGPVYNVALSALSRLQSDPKQYRAFYCKAILAITTLGMPLVAFTSASAHKLILVVLGQQWLEVVPIFQFLMPAAFVTTFNVATGWVYQSLGRADRQLRWGMVSSTIIVLMFLISVRWGATGVAAGYGITYPLLMAIEVVYCYKGTPLVPMDLLKTLSKPAIASLGAGAILVLINQLILVPVSASISLLVDFVVFSGLYIAVWMLLPNGRKTLLEILGTVKKIKKK